MNLHNKVAPDGGYGWVIVFANALSNFIILSLQQCFGLIFKDTFSELNLSATQGSFIINLNAAFGRIMGPVTGILLKMCGCRKTAFLAGIFFTAGMVLTSLSKSFVSFVVAYGLITSLGMQMTELVHRVALNLYFNKKRSVVLGFAITIAGLGQIFVPQLIRVLLKIHSAQGAALIFAGICTHVFVAAVLLQPVKWHLKEDITKKNECLTKEAAASGENKKEETILQRILNSFARTFDLDLLGDPIFDNILLGVALATFAEINFTLLTPFILRDFGLNTDQIAIFLSTLGVADMIFRFFGPHIGNYFTKPSRLMYAYALLILVMVRFTLLLTRNYYALLAIAFVWGVAKGVRKVYMWLVIPDYVPVEKLSTAGGIETLANGICMLVGGPILGMLRDATGSYVICIIVMNFVTLVTIVLWSVEAIIVKYNRKKRRNYISEQNSEEEGLYAER